MRDDLAREKASWQRFQMTKCISACEIKDLEQLENSDVNL